MEKEGLTMKDYYATLKIDKSAGQTEIKKAYFALVRVYPPDKHPEEFMQIREAYEVLIDENTRSQYNAIDTMPDIVKMYFKEGQIALEAGEVEDAIRLLEQVIKSYPHFSVVNSLLGEAYLQNDNSGKAIRIFESLVKKEQNNAGFVRQLAHAYAMRGWRNKAITCYEKALTLDEDNISLWLGLIECYLEGKEFNQARETILAGLEVSNKEGWDNLPLYAHIINADIFSENPEDLQKHLAEMKKKALENEEEQTNIGWYLARLSKKIADLSFHRESAELIAAAAAILPEDESVMQIKKEVDSQNIITLQLDKLAEDVDISFEIDKLLSAELDMCDKKVCQDCDINRFMHEMDIIVDMDAYRIEIIRLKNNYPILYNLKKDFFDNVLNPKMKDFLLDTYHKKFTRYKKLRPERFATEDDEEWDDPIPQPYVRPEPKVGRNDPCPCGSGKKYKKCCGG
jgi:curved DNA-binding protein CbpA